MDHPVLDQLVLAYGALFNAKRQPAISRLTLHPLVGSPAELADGVLAMLAADWSEANGPLALNPTSEPLLHALLARPAPAHIQLEVPAFMAADPAGAELLREHAKSGSVLVLKGRPLAPLPPDLAGCFKHVIVDAAEDRRQQPAPANAPARSTPWVIAAAPTAAVAADALKRGALAVQGWPLGEAPGANVARKDVPASAQVVMNLIQRVDREEPANKLDAVLRGDPALAFKLMRLINSPAFGLSVEVSSFQHAIMILGYQRLKRWLALLMTSAVDSPDLKPLMFLAVRRGLLMEDLARSLGDESARSEAFICGVFSLLDRMLGQPFDRLLSSLPVAEGVAQTLVGENGPYRQSLNLAIAIESESPHDITDATSEMLLSAGEVNRAAWKALLASRQMQPE